MRWAAFFLLSITACSERVEVELHPHDDDKSVIIVIEDSEGLRAFGQNLVGGAEGSLTQAALDNARVHILYLSATLQDHGLSPGQLALQESGIPLPLPSQQEQWTAELGKTEPDPTIRFAFRVAHSRCSELALVESAGSLWSSIQLAPGRSLNVAYRSGIQERSLVDGRSRVNVETALTNSSEVIAYAAGGSVWVSHGLYSVAQASFKLTTRGTYYIESAKRFSVEAGYPNCTFGPYEAWACARTQPASVDFQNGDELYKRVLVNEACDELHWITADCVACVAGTGLYEVCADDSDFESRTSTGVARMGSSRAFRDLDGRLGFVDDRGSVRLRESSGLWRHSEGLNDLSEGGPILPFLGGFHYSTGTHVFTVLLDRGRCRALQNPRPGSTIQRIHHWGDAFALTLEAQDRRVFEPLWE